MSHHVSSGAHTAKAHGTQPVVSGDGAPVLEAVAMIPESRKRAFLKVQQLNPDLIWTEVNPVKFLEFAEGDYWRAAEALVKYWELREELFEDRAVLPLSQTGNGALNAEDVITLHSGKFAFLPPTPNGQQVMFVDRQRALSSSTTKSKLRVAFYMLQQVTLAEDAQTVGCHILVLLVGPRHSPADVPFIREGLKLVNIFPAKIFMHYLLCMPKSGWTPLIQNVVVPAVSYGMANALGVKMHNKAAGEPILSDLKEDVGLEPDSLPASIGGTWKYENHTIWCRHKTQQEHAHEMKKNCSTRGTNSSKTEEGGIGTHNKRKRSQDLNAIHSRLKRERRKSEEMELTEKHERLSAQNKTLKATHAFLDKLVREANVIVRLNETKASPRISDSAGKMATDDIDDGSSSRNSLPPPLRDVILTNDSSASSEQIAASSEASPQAQLAMLSLSIDFVMRQSLDVQRFLVTALRQNVQMHQTQTQQAEQSHRDTGSSSFRLPSFRSTSPDENR